MRAAARATVTPLRRPNRSASRDAIAARADPGCAASAGAVAWIDRSNCAASAENRAIATRSASASTAAVLPVDVDAGEEWSVAATRAHGSHRRASAPRRSAVVPSDNVVALCAPDRRRRQRRFAARVARGDRRAIRRSCRASSAARALEGRASNCARPTARRARSMRRAPIRSTPHAAPAIGCLRCSARLPPAEHEGAGELSLAELSSALKRRVLSNDFVTARRLIEQRRPSLARDAGHAPSARPDRVPLGPARRGAHEFRNAARAQTSAENDPVLRARALYGSAPYRCARIATTMRCATFGEAIALTSTRNEPAVLGQAYTGLAAAQVNLGRFDEAADNLGRARVAVGLAGDTLQLARVDANEGVLDNARGRHAEALPILQRAAERFRQFGALNELFLTVAARDEGAPRAARSPAALAVSEPVWARARQARQSGQPHRVRAAARACAGCCGPPDRCAQSARRARPLCLAGSDRLARRCRFGECAYLSRRRRRAGRDGIGARRRDAPADRG